MTNRMLAVAVSLALACAGLFAFLWESRRANRLPEVPVASPVVDSGIGDDKSDVAGQPRARPSNSNPTPMTLSARERYKRSRDLFALVQDLRGPAKSGDAEAETIIADAYFECMEALLPETRRYAGVASAEKANPQLKPYIDSLVTLDRARCGRFDKQDIGGFQNVMAMYADAARNGSAEALAKRLTFNANLDDMSDAELAADIQQIKNSGDPYAIGALAGLMGPRAENREAVFGSPSGNEYAEYAWQLAACQMGMDCGPGSPFVRGNCLNSGYCEATSVDGLLSSYVLSPIQYRTVLAMSHQIVSGLAAGN